MFLLGPHSPCERFQLYEGASNSVMVANLYIDRITFFINSKYLSATLSIR